MHPNDGRVVSNFIMPALQGNDITIYGDGAQARSFCDVDDLVDAMVRMMNSDEGFVGRVNVGNPNPFTILQLAEEVIRLTGKRSSLVRHPLPTHDPKQRQPDISVARQRLGWEPQIQLEAGLKATIAYFRESTAAGAARKN